MNNVFRPFLRQYVLVFSDDILIYSRSREEHLYHLLIVIEILQAHGLRVKKSKCLWGPRVEYLGYFISSVGVAADPVKVVSMVLAMTKGAEELRGFLGLIGYFRRFIQGNEKIAAPLITLLRKGRFEWDNKAKRAFEELTTTFFVELTHLG
ncbi:uncharacterized mitochondrial protein AtMg00860-like [Typha latifolia]|uniref:uncharacterized mitochondrial protein AtMg00860-like n=1 Tax=Typha latifolia TaxID=4733 RepID=UPI003C2F290D